MKKIFPFFIMLIISHLAKSQTILSGSEIFDKNRKEGFYMNINIEDKYIKKDWEGFITKYGNVKPNKGIYTISSAKMNDISPDPILLLSKITGDRGKSTVFCALDLGGGNVVTSNSSSFDGVEKMMKDFYKYAMHNEDIRLAQRDAEEAQKNLDRVAKTGDKLSRDIEKNKREKENLLKKIEENRLELEQFLKDQIANKQDQENAKVALEDKKRSVQIVKEKN